MLAVLVYLAAVAFPVYLLYHFGPQSWYWHIIAIAAGTTLGFVPIPAELQQRGVDLLLGFALAFLLIWGIGGLIAPHRQRVKHA